jgi:hypothetical protein
MLSASHETNNDLNEYSSHLPILAYDQQQSFHISQPKSAANKRLKLSLASLIGQAILNAPGNKARLGTIYEWIALRYPDQYQLNHGGWQVRFVVV